MAPSIPDRWIPYKACGRVIDGTRLICFKVPLRKAVQEGKREIKEIWDIKTLLERVPQLGAVIDLTNTARYYNPKELEKQGIVHKKILMPGRVLPPEDKVIEFMDTVDELLGKDCEFLIGVHCTHGLNRTGYMVCRYMRDRLNIPAKDAIKKFEKARGYQIERDNYVANILGEVPPAPDLGSETTLKPTGDRDSESRHREYANRLNMRNKTQGQFSGQQGSRNKSDKNYNWRTERRSFDSDSEYDFKYDY